MGKVDYSERCTSVLLDAFRFTSRAQHVDEDSLDVKSVFLGYLANKSFLGTETETGTHTETGANTWAERGAESATQTGNGGKTLVTATSGKPLNCQIFANVYFWGLIIAN